MKRVLGILLICAMVLSGMTTMAFAGEETYPNFLGNVWTNNWSCIHNGDAEVSIKITKEGMDDVVVPVPFNEEIGEYYVETVVEGVDEIIKEVGPVYDATLSEDSLDVTDALAIMKDLGYSVEVVIVDNDEEHEFIIGDDEVYVDFLTAASLQLSLDFTIEFIEELLVMFDPTYEPTGSFEAFIEAYKEMLMDPEGGDLTAEEAEEALAEIYTLEEMIAALESGEYAGEMTVYLAASCDCPELVEYTLYHEYYDEEGEYVAQETEFLAAENGQVVTAEDLEDVYVTEYDGVEYEVEGMYLLDCETLEVDWENPVDEFTVIDYYDEETEEYYWTEVVVKYVPVSEEPGEDPGDEPGNVPGAGGDDEQKPADKPADKEEPKEDGKVPTTGDNANMVLYVLLLGAAVVALKKVRA